MKLSAFLLAACAAALPFAAPAGAAELELWRLDCGSVEVRDLSLFSDTFGYQGKHRTLTDSCYLIRHDAQYMLWDTGLPTALIGAKPDAKAPMAPVLTVDIASQLAKIRIAPDKISLIGISHNHFDHLGQAAVFPGATLLMGKADLEALKDKPPPFGVEPKLLEPWFAGIGKVDPVQGDRDVFGDGSVVMLAMPGHTPGEASLLVKLPQSGPVLLSGDVVHFEEQLANHGVPPFNWNRAASLASIDRLLTIAKTLNAKIIVQHDENDIAKLPAFPKSAR